MATPEEDRSLTEAADLLAAELEARGLTVGHVYDRLNRRKIDLISEPDWADPPKSRIAPLLKTVQARLRRAGLRGLDEVLERAAEAARSRGLPEPCITSDAKHIEIGLTDKKDAVEWMMQELAAPRGLGPSDVLPAGDEFGFLDGAPGGDADMIRLRPGGGFRLRGFRAGRGAFGGDSPGRGPREFLELLGRQVALREGPCGPDLPGPPPSDPEWLLVEEGFQLVRGHELESLFAVSNGHVGIRGSLEERTSLSRSGTFVAGIFGQDPRPGAVPELFTSPDGLGRALLVEGESLVPENVENLEHRRVLDLRPGILRRGGVHLAGGGRTGPGAGTPAGRNRGRGGRGPRGPGRRDLVFPVGGRGGRTGGERRGCPGASVRRLPSDRSGRLRRPARFRGGARPDGGRLQGIRLLGYRDVHGALLRLYASRRGPRLAPLPVSHTRGRPSAGLRLRVSRGAP